MMELREMRAFVDVVEAGGLAAAARKLGVSQSELSQTITALERRFEARLLVRTRSGAHPTEFGLVLLAEARSVLERHDRALSILAGKLVGGGDLLRLGLALDLPPDLLAAPFAALEAEFPATQVTVLHLPQALRESALRTGRLDIGLLYDRPTGDELDSVLVLEEPLGVVLPTRRAAGLAGADGIALETLADLEWVGFPRHEAPGFHDEVAAVLRGHGLRAGDPQPDSRVLIPEVRLAEVAAGRAFTLAPQWLARQLPESLTWCPMAGDPIMRRTWAAWAASSQRRDIGHFITAFPEPTRARSRTKRSPVRRARSSVHPTPV